LRPRRGRQAVDFSLAPRVRRARTLIADHSHTEPLLRFYLEMLECQTVVCLPLDVSRWLPVVEAASPEDMPRLHLERLPLDELAVAFATFCRDLPETAPAPVAHAAGLVAGAHHETRMDLLLSLLTGAQFEDPAARLGCSSAPLAFLPRGFLSPIAETLSDLVPATGSTTRAHVCPRCGWPPQVSMLADEPATQGNRRLVCAFCAADWIFPRSVCPACGVSGDEGLEFHVDNRLPHVRVEACKTCRGYLKSVDLRVIGIAEPLVDDLATPELDLWAIEQGLEKIVQNVLGF
jgi:formate dehydrogenase accessory protein FdhE